ncbi:unnamed protein product [Tuber aestivum]|uniref:Uncharacterized protein n=1 Tax=Tuber aestivum TaxID=59557 RepID=A0A292Q1A2_9PEZI|nr:unnamed protein product [Tuber aestivum]
MIPLSRQPPFDEKLVCLMQRVSRELRGLDALSFEDSGVIEAALAEVRLANTDMVKALFPLIAHVNYIDDCLIRRQDMWDTTRAVMLWVGGVKSLERLISGKRGGFYEALERTTASFESASETTDLAFKCGKNMAVATGRLCNKNVLELQGEISNIGRELQDVAKLCAEEEANVKLKGKYLEGRLHAELRGREDLEDEISEEPDQRGGVLKTLGDGARAMVLGLAFTYTIPGVFTFGFFASISVVTYFLTSWKKIFRREKDKQSIQGKIMYSERKIEELERRLKAIEGRTSQLHKATEAYEEAQHLFSLLSPRAGSMQLMTSQFETLLSRRKTLAENRVATIRSIRPPDSPSWYRHSRADVVALLEGILEQFKQDYEQDTITSEEEAITAELEEKLGYLQSRTRTLQKIHGRIRIESDGVEDSDEIRKGSWEHLRLSAILLVGATMAVFYAWNHRRCFLQAAKFVTRQTGRSIIWTLKGALIKLWQTMVNMLFGLRTPLRLLCALAPGVAHFALNVSLRLGRLALDYAFRLPLKVMLVVVFMLFRMFTTRFVVLGVMGWFLVYHGPAWDEIWDVVYDWAVWGAMTGWKWLWEFSGSEGASQALVIVS